MRFDDIAAAAAKTAPPTQLMLKWTRVLSVKYRVHALRLSTYERIHFKYVMHNVWWMVDLTGIFSNVPDTFGFAISDTWQLYAFGLTHCVYYAMLQRSNDGRLSLATGRFEFYYRNIVFRYLHTFASVLLSRVLIFQQCQRIFLCGFHLNFWGVELSFPFVIVFRVLLPLTWFYFQLGFTLRAAEKPSWIRQSQTGKQTQTSTIRT